MLQVHTIPCRVGTMDNYAYLIVDKQTNISAVIDPSEAAPIIKTCQDLNIAPNFILNTHHHFDHIEANLPLAERYGAKIVCSQTDLNKIPSACIGLNDNQIFMLGNTEIQAIDVSAHTIGHILFYVKKDKLLFTGDTLFNLSIGGIFEGSSYQMYQALQKIKSLPNDVMFYPGHEYTYAGIAFATQYNHNNQAIQQYLSLAQKRLGQGLPVAPVSLGEEKMCNPYLEADSFEAFQAL